MHEEDKRRNAFVNACQEDSARFEKPITRTKIMNFACETFQIRNKSKKSAAITQTVTCLDYYFC